MKKLLLVVFFLPLQALAGPYLGLGLGFHSDSVESPPNQTPAHPVSVVRSSANDDNLGLGLHVGYLWPSNIYTELEWFELSRRSYHDINYIGEDVNFSHRTRARREEETDTLALRLGKRFEVAKLIAVYAEIGGHRYSTESIVSVEQTQAPKPNGTTTVTASSSVTSKNTDTAVVYGGGVMFAGANGPFGIKLGASRYGGIDRTVVSLALQLHF